MADDRRLTRFSLFKRAAGLVLFVEQCWAAATPLFAVLALFIIISLLGVWQWVPPTLHVCGLVLFIAAALFTAYQAIKKLRAPAALQDQTSADPAISRLEQDSALPAHSLDSINDELSAGSRDALTQALWRRERERARGLIANLQLSPPRSPLPKLDPWALRAGLGLLLVIALVDASGQTGERLSGIWQFQRAAASLASNPPSGRLWITPPNYTGVAPIQLASNLEPAVSDAPETEMIAATVPSNSEMMLQLQDLLAIDGAPLNITLGERDLAFEALGANGAEVRTTLDQSGVLTARQGDLTVAEFDITLIEDAFPNIAFSNEPTQTERGVLKVDLSASDDYGIVETRLVMDAENLDEPFVISIGKPRARTTEIEAARYLDLTANKLAGLPVMLTLQAVDAIEQIGESETIDITLPERPFSHPLAQAIIKARKQLVANPNQVFDVARILNRLAETEDAQSFGTVVPFALNMAASRLQIERTPEGRDSTVELLWETALFVEDGSLSLSEQLLRDLQERLAEALENGAELSELEQMLAELQQALDQFLAEMMRQALEQQQQANPDQPPSQLPPDAQLVDRQDLQDMLEEIRDLLQQGRRDEAMEMMAELREMLENLQAATAQPQQASPGEQALNDLQQMMQAQQNLLERTHRLQQQGMDPSQMDPSQMDGDDAQRGPQNPNMNMNNMAQEQDALRQALGELMRRLGENGMPIPRSLGQAELQMRDARNALQQGDPGQAMGPESNALDMMQQGGQALLEELREQMANQPGQGMGQPNQAAQRPGRDPLGRERRNDGGSSTAGTEVPPENDLGRARSVLEELQRRAGDRNRPSSELDYLNRLLDRF